jgi:tRNA(Ile2) C34 agmatinyltransferase TiaS
MENKHNRNFNSRNKRSKPPVKKCPFCGSDMKAKGASDSAGGVSFKCRNKHCGRRVWIHSDRCPPLIPLVPYSKFTSQ